MSTVYLSRHGFKDLRKEISRLEAEEKSLHAELKEIGRAKSRDDKLRRADVMTQLETVVAKLLTRREALHNAKPLPRKRDRLRVALGSVVDMVDQQGRLVRYTLVDSVEANPLDGRISIESPLGKNLVGRKPSETVSWSVGSSTKQLRLVRVN